jgi:quercetin dioxygenase-like cupin family protein
VVRKENDDTLGLGAAVKNLEEVIGQAHVTTRDAQRLGRVLEALTGEVGRTTSREGGFLEPDGSLRLAQWAGPGGTEADGFPDLAPESEALPMLGTLATGTPLVSNGYLGVDLIQVPKGSGFAPHKHPGDHLLIVVRGTGTVAYEGNIYQTEPGQTFLIEGSKPHSLGAITDHALLAVGAPHRQVDAVDRQTATAYRAVAASLGDMTCKICKLSATFPERLKDLGCPHCPSRLEG